MNSLIKKQLNLTCPECRAVYELLEIHQQKHSHCQNNCLAQWQKILHQHFQEQIILHLAQQEAQKDQNDKQ